MDFLINAKQKIIRKKKTAVQASVCLLFTCLCFYPVYADEPPRQLEQKIKAGLVYNLLKYTSWPKEFTTSSATTKAPATTGESSAIKKDELQVCLFGDDPFDGYLAPLQGRTAQQFLISITHVKQANETDICNVVIIHRSQEKHLSELLDYLNDKPVLTISDIGQFSHRGGMIEMAKEDEKISLYVNKDAIDHARLDIEGHMLKLAKIVSR